MSSKPAADQSTRPSVTSQVAAIRRRAAGGAPLEGLILELAEQRVRLDDLQRQLRALKAESSLRDALLPELPRQYLGRTQARIDAGLPLETTAGFYGLEYDDSGVAFRWTGPDREFHFDLHLDRSIPLLICLTVAAQWGGEPGQLRCFADDVEIQLQSKPAGQCIELTGIAMPRLRVGLTRLSFLAKDVFQPPATPSGPDERRLGVAFFELVVSAADEQQALDALSQADSETKLRKSQQGRTARGGNASKTDAPEADAGSAA